MAGVTGSIPVRPTIYFPYKTSSKVNLFIIDMPVRYLWLGTFVTESAPPNYLLLPNLQSLSL